MEQIFLSLGSNLGDPLQNLRQALARLAEFATVQAVSHAYESEPVDYTSQPWFVNAAVCLQLEESSPEEAPQALLERVLAIERAMGRRRDELAPIPKGPRIIDLDIVLFGTRIIRTASLTVPHPAMHLRRFVLEPLAEIAPGAMHPLLHKSASQLLNELPAGGPAVRMLVKL